MTCKYDEILGLGHIEFQEMLDYNLFNISLLIFFFLIIVYGRIHFVLINL